MLLRQLLLTGKIAKCFHRSYVSTVNVNVVSLNSIRVVMKDFHKTSSEEVKLTILDSNNNEVEASNIESLRVVNTPDTFQMDCNESQDISVLIELPIASSLDVNLDVKAESSSVHVENLQTTNVDLSVKNGDISINNLKGHSIKANTEHGNITTSNILLGKKVKLTAKSGNILVGKSQGDELEVEAKSMTIKSCYNKTSHFTSTSSAFLKNVHGVATVKSSGESFKLSGFSGAIKAQLDSESVEIQLSNLEGESFITSDNRNANIKIGLSDSVLQKTNIKISSNASLDSYIDALMVYHIKKKNLYEVQRVNEQTKNHLNVVIKAGKNVELNLMSWIDFLKFV